MTKWKWAGAIASGVIVVFAVSHAGATTFWTTPYKPDLMASWVQAVGSIGAIVGAIWAVTHQMGNARTDRVAAILAVAEAARDRAKEFSLALDAENPRLDLWSKFHPSVIASYVAALSAVQVHEIRSAAGIIAFLSLRDQFVFMGRAIEIFLEGPGQHEEMKKGLEDAQRAYPDNNQYLRDLYNESEKVLSDNARRRMQQVSDEYDRLRASLSAGFRPA